MPIFVGIVIMIIERKPIRPMLKGLALYPLFLGSWLLINFKCLFVRDTKWEKIDHVRDIKIKDVNVAVVPKTTVIPLGTAIGMKLYTKGVLVVGMSQIKDENNEKKKPYDSSLSAGHHTVSRSIER